MIPPARALLSFRWLSVLGLLGALLLSRPALAQITDPQVALFPDPTKYARGLYVEAETGGAFFLGNLGTHLAPGFALGTRVGYDLTRFFAVQAHATASSHVTSFVDEPHDGQLVQILQAMGEMRLTFRAQSWGFVAQGGAGIAHTSTNVLQAAGLNRFRNSLLGGGGLGVDYHTLSRHLAVGLRADGYYLRDLAKSTEITVATYLRYTF